MIYLLTLISVVSLALDMPGNRINFFLTLPAPLLTCLPTNYGTLFSEIRQPAELFHEVPNADFEREVSLSRTRGRINAETRFRIRDDAGCQDLAELRRDP